MSVMMCCAEFGQVLATCSFDRTASVWEEIVGERAEGGGRTHWVKRTCLVDSRTSVTDVKFGPKQLGLILATCSADGTVKQVVYEFINNKIVSRFVSTRPRM